ncbi:MAG: UDP-N-acetylglucosamine 1-carboxyvinyltransferase [bacterium]|nr:UDP-N-acetylglucosamine 1-carboxyvinyltransferase [bacterium]
MDRFIIEGGRLLTGEIQVSGAKNAALPLMSAALLADGEYLFENMPNLRDTRTMLRLLNDLGAVGAIENNKCVLRVTPSNTRTAYYDLVKTMRASFYVLGPLLARYGEARVSLPGGCAWGPRPVDQHLKGLTKLGAQIDIDAGYVVAKAEKLVGTEIIFEVSSVGATGNVLMAAIRAEGTTILENCAREPEIVQLCEMLVAMGAQIEGIGQSRLTIHGVSELHPVAIKVIPDRIEAGTYLIAAAITGSKLRVANCYGSDLGIVLDKLREAGCVTEIGQNVVDIERTGSLHAVDIKTAPYPGFPTDLQAQWIALMTQADGDSRVTETIYFDRFTHIAELQRLGAEINLDGNVAVVAGGCKLKGAPVMSTDIRASSSLVLAGLAATGTTSVSRIYHLDRGYEQLEVKLMAAGASIRRERED